MANRCRKRCGVLSVDGIACLVLCLGFGFVLGVLFRMRLRLSLILLCCGWGLLVVLLMEVVEGWIAAARSWLWWD